MGCFVKKIELPTDTYWQAYAEGKQSGFGLTPEQAIECFEFNNGIVDEPNYIAFVLGWYDKA